MSKADKAFHNMVVLIDLDHMEFPEALEKTSRRFNLTRNEENKLKKRYS